MENKPSNYIDTSVASRQYAAKNNWDVRVPYPNEVTVDIDDEPSMKHFEYVLQALKEEYPLHDFMYETVPSKSGAPHHCHVLLRWPDDLPELGVLGRIAIQALMGSDPKRELCSFVRHLKGDPEPILVFEGREGGDNICQQVSFAPEDLQWPEDLEEEPEQPTPWAVHCLGVDTGFGANPCTSKLIYLTREQYLNQMKNTNYGWRCPNCGGDADFDDKNYEDTECPI